MERQTITGSLSTSGRLSGALSVGGGTTDYNVLVNKPKINNVELVGNKNYIDLGLEPAINYPDDQTKYYNGRGQWTTPPSGVTSYNDLTDKPSINGVTLSGNKTPDDFGLSSKGQFNSLSGVIVSFNDGQDLPLAKCIAEIVPKQAGSGTPSPDNVRTISGYTAVKVNVSGKNLCLPINNTTWNGVTTTTSSGATAVSGTATSNGGRNALASADFILSAGTYTLSHNGTGTWGNELVLTRKSNSARLAELSSNNSSVTFTIESQEECHIGFNVINGTSYSGTVRPQIEIGTESSAFEPYIGTTYTTPLGQTVYGGQLNVLTGELTIEHVQYVFDGSERIVAQNAGWGTNVLGNTIKPNINNNTMSDILCDIFSPEIPSHVWNHASDNIIGIAVESDNYKIRFYSSAFVGKTSSEVATEMTGHMLVFPLATPQTVQLTPQEVNSLLGQNNISADTGAIGITYINNVNDPIIKYILNNM